MAIHTSGEDITAIVLYHLIKTHTHTPYVWSSLLPARRTGLVLGVEMSGVAESTSTSGSTNSTTIHRTRNDLCCHVLPIQWYTPFENTIQTRHRSSSKTTTTTSASLLLGSSTNPPLTHAAHDGGPQGPTLSWSGVTVLFICCGVMDGIVHYTHSYHTRLFVAEN